MLHFYNLSNGLACVHPYMEVPELRDMRYLRLQSTHCEQKLWTHILRNLGPEFLMAAATEMVIVHDQSEKDREPRAMWQGLEWVRYALERNWFSRRLLLDGSRKQPPMNVAKWSYGRNGMLLSRYWEEQYRRLPKSVVNEIRYYRKFVEVERPLIFSCHRV